MTKKECVEWTSEGSCAKYKYTDEDGMIVDISACPLSEKKLIKKEIRRGFKVIGESEEEEEKPQTINKS